MSGCNWQEKRYVCTKKDDDSRIFLIQPSFLAGKACLEDGVSENAMGMDCVHLMDYYESWGWTCKKVEYDK